MLGSRWKKLAAVVLSGVILYALAGFLLAPWLIKRELAARFLEHTGRQLSIGAVAVNPFTLDVELTNLTLDEAAGAPPASVDRVHAKVRATSLLSRVWIIRHMTIDRPQLSFSASRAAAAIVTSMDMDIELLEVSRGALRISTSSPEAGAPGLPLELTDIELQIKNLGAAPGKQGNFTLAAIINQSTQLKGEGSFSPSPAALDASLNFAGLDATALGIYIDLGPALELSSARLTASTRVRYEEGRTQLSGDIKIHELEIAASSDGEPVFTAATIFGTGIVFDAAPRRVSAKSVRIESPYLKTERAPDGGLNLPHWLLPLVTDPVNAAATISEIELSDGRLEFTDLSLAPPVRISADHIRGKTIQRGAGAETTIMLSLEGQVNAAGAGKYSATWKPYNPGDSTTVELELRNIKLPSFSPYFAGFTGREITSGNLAMELDYRISDNELRVKDHFLVDGLKLGDWVEPRIATELPLDLAVALLRDDNERINMTLEVAGTRLDASFDPGAFLREAFADFITGVAEAPFAVIGELAGQAGEELSKVVFTSGSAAISQPAAQKLASLGQALSQRPGLGLKVSPAYDPVADRNTLARQQMRLHIALATSAGPPGRATQKPLDLNDPKVTAILDEFANERLGEALLAMISAHFPGQEQAYYQTVFEALVANEAVSITALNTLARYRARSVVDQLVSSGIQAERLMIADDIATNSGEHDAVAVRLEVLISDPWDRSIQPAAPDSSD